MFCIIIYILQTYQVHQYHNYPSIMNGACSKVHGILILLAHLVYIPIGGVHLTNTKVCDRNFMVLYYTPLGCLKKHPKGCFDRTIWGAWEKWQLAHPKRCYDHTWSRVLGQGNDFSEFILTWGCWPIYST